MSVMLSWVDRSATRACGIRLVSSVHTNPSDSRPGISKAVLMTPNARRSEAVW